MVELRFNMSLPDQVKLRILFNIPDNESYISGGVIVDFSSFEFGSDNDKNETVTTSSGFSFEFIPDGESAGIPPTMQQLKKILRQLKQSGINVYVYKKVGAGAETLFFLGVVDQEDVECDYSSRSISLQVVDYAQSLKDRSYYGGFYELDPNGPGDPYHPALTFIENEANPAFDTIKAYPDIVTDSNVAAAFQVSGTTYYATLNGLFNAGLGKKAYIGFMNRYLFSAVSSISPRRLGDVLKHIGNCFGCVVVPGYEGKLFFLQRFRNVNKSPVTISTSDIEEIENVRVVRSARAMYLNLWKNWLRNYGDGTSKYYSVKSEDVRMPFGAIIGAADALEEEMMFYRPPYFVSQLGQVPAYIDTHAGIMCLVKKPALVGSKWWDYYPAMNSLFEIIGEGSNYNSMYDIYAAKIWPQINTPRLNFVLKLSGTNWALDSYYYVPIDESGNTTVYRCRKIKYDFKEGTTTLDLIEFIESVPDPGSAEYPLIARPGTGTPDTIIMSDNY